MKDAKWEPKKYWEHKNYISHSGDPASKTPPLKKDAKSRALDAFKYAHSQFHNMKHGGGHKGRKLDLSDLKGVREIVGKKYGHSMDTYSKVGKAYKKLT